MLSIPFDSSYIIGSMESKQEYKKFFISKGNQLLITITVVLIVLAFSNQVVKEAQLKVQRSLESSVTGTPTLVPDFSTTQGPGDQEIKDTDISQLIHPSPTRVQSITPSPDISNSSFQYPNSLLIETSGNETKYESSDSPQVITNWYRARVAELGFRTTAAVQTNSNGNIINKLGLASESSRFEIEIRKDFDDQKTLIKIERFSS